MLKWEQLPTPRPGPSEALIQHEAVGLNYIDVYFRTGFYKAPLPCTIGMEGAGTVLSIGDNVTGLSVGDRVAYAGGPLGAYATVRVIPADRLVKLPPEIDSKTAAAMMLAGITAQFLLHRTFKVQPGQTILLHAAAGGVGLIMCQWAKHLGANVIGVVSTEEKAALAKANGAAHTIIGHANLAADVKKITGGAMVPVVYDSIGKDTFGPSLDCLAPLGLMVSFGASSGPVPPYDIGALATKAQPVPHPPHLRHLHRRPGRSYRQRRRPFRRRRLRGGQNPDQPDLQAGRRRRRAHSAGSPPDHRQHRPPALTPYLPARLIAFWGALALGTLLSMAYIDQPLALYFNQAQMLRPIFNACAAPSLLALPLSGLYLTWLVLQKCRGQAPANPVWLAMSLATLAATAAKDELKWLFLGCSWPMFWLKDGIYGFHPLHRQLFLWRFPLRPHRLYFRPPRHTLVPETPPAASLRRPHRAGHVRPGRSRLPLPRRCPGRAADRHDLRLGHTGITPPATALR